MLTFFRRIRKGLLGSGQARKPASSPVPSGTEGNVERYLLYAIGEIALVVIGILIALQINNWNEWRKDRIKEKIILQNLMENLESNILILESSLEVVNDQNHSSQIITLFFKRELPYSDTLDLHFYSAILTSVMQGQLTEDGYESFKNAGFELLRSDFLKKRIINVFEVIYQALEEWRDNMISFNPVFMQIRHSEFVQYEKGMKPQELESLADNQDIQSAFYNSFMLRNIMFNRLSECLSESKQVLQLIKEELHGAEISHQDDRQ